MKIEHFAINVDQPKKMAQWYQKHLGLEVVKQEMKMPFTTFLADDSGSVMLEVYKNPPGEVPDYHAMNPLILHLAFVSEDPEKDKARLLNAGATLVNDEKLLDGSRVVMLKDPWGVSVQLCKRNEPMLRNWIQ